MARKRGRFALFFLLIVGSFLLFLFGRRLVHRPSLAKDNAAGGSNENDASEFDPAAVVEDHRRYKVKTWSFPLARYELTIEDTSMTTAIDGTLAKAEAELVVNGGFFGPDQKPLGLAMSKGAVLSRLSKQMSGGVLSSDFAPAIVSTRFGASHGIGPAFAAAAAGSSTPTSITAFDRARDLV